MPDMTNLHEYVLFSYFQGGAEGGEGGDPAEKEKEQEESHTKVLPDVVAEGGNRWWEEDITVEKVQELIKRNLTPAERKGSKKKRSQVN